MKQQVRVVVFNKERYDGDWPPEVAVDFLRWFQDKVQSIPPEYRDNAKVEIDATGGYEGSYYATIEITYERSETDAEYAARLEGARRATDDRQRQERALYEQLRAKYER